MVNHGGDGCGGTSLDHGIERASRGAKTVGKIKTTGGRHGDGCLCGCRCSRNENAMVSGRRKRNGNSSGMFRRNKKIAMQRMDDGVGRLDEKTGALVKTAYCYLCDRPGARDGGHIISYEDGGTDAVTNIAITHGVWDVDDRGLMPRCNQRWGDKPMVRGALRPTSVIEW